MCINNSSHSHSQFPAIKLFGNACTVYSIHSDTIARHNLITLAESLGAPLQEAILDLNFYSLLNNPLYTSLQSIAGSTTSGLILDAKSRIELRIAPRKKRIISPDDLLFQSTLFPLYNTDCTTLNLESQQMYVVEKETGLFSSFNVPSNSFDISRLEFTLTTLKIPHENLTLLSLINYDQKPLKSLKSDTVLTANYAFILP